MTRSNKHRLRAALCLLLLLSPIGAPVVGAFISSACPMVPYGGDGLPISEFDCGISSSLEGLYQLAAIAAWAPLVMEGASLAAKALALMWWLSGFALVVGSVWHLAQALRWRAA